MILEVFAFAVDFDLVRIDEAVLTDSSSSELGVSVDTFLKTAKDFVPRSSGSLTTVLFFSTFNSEILRFPFVSIARADIFEISFAEAATLKTKILV